MASIRPQTSAELTVHLREQLAFLRTSAAAYDAGTEIEAKRLAVVLRTLLHDTGSSVSLLKQLGIKSALRFYDRYADGQGKKAGVFIGVGMKFAEGGLNTSQPSLSQLLPLSLRSTGTALRSKKGPVHIVAATSFSEWLIKMAELILIRRWSKRMRVSAETSQTHGP